VPNDSYGYERLYAASEILLKQSDARPHLGKYCTLFHKDDMRRLHGADFDTFLRVCAEQDPGGKFRNSFTRRLFWD